MKNMTLQGPDLQTLSIIRSPFDYGERHFVVGLVPQQNNIITN